MSLPKYVVVSDAGAPEDNTNWSGTPLKLIRALRDHGCDVVSSNMSPSRTMLKLLKLASLVTNQGRDFRHTAVVRTYHRLAHPQLQASPGRIFLHMGTSTIPRRRRTRRAVHAVLIDTTFHLRSQFTLEKISAAAVRSYDQYEGQALNAVDHIFTVSECAREDVINHYGVPAVRVTAVGTGFGNVRPSDYEKDYSAHRILFIGKQRFEEKGGLLLLEAFRRAKKVNSKLHLTVVASESYRDTTLAIPGTDFESAIPWDKLEGLFNAAALYVMPAIFEPWGLVYLEAMLCRTPILGLRRNSLPEITQNGKFGFLVDDDDPSLVSEAILNAFSDLPRLSSMGKGAQERVRARYGWDKAAARILGAFDR